MRPSTKFIIEYGNTLPQGANVLDIGCGTGRELNRIAQSLSKLNFFACDFEDTSAKLDDKIHFKKADLKDILDLFGGRKYDIIIVQHVLEHMTYPIDVVAKFQELLTEQGRVFVESPNWTRLFVPFHRNFFWNDPSHFRPFTKRSYKDLCKNANLEPLTIMTRSSITFKDSLQTIFNSKSIVLAFKRVISTFIDPFLKDNIILIARVANKK